MVNYQNGKIYKIEGNGLIYYGSTCEPTLARRFASHKQNYKGYVKGNRKFKTSSYECLVDENATITLVEKCPCNSKDELASREAFYINNNPCVNKNIPNEIVIENSENYSKEYNQKYYELNENYFKDYYQCNKEHIKELSKISSKKKYFCDDCKCEVVSKHRFTHFQTVKHQNNLLQNSQQ
jgi:hypothetical protein